MQKVLITIISVVMLFTTGCGIFPVERSIEPGKARLVNFVRQINVKKEFLAVVCTDKEAPGFVISTDIDAGARQILVKATTYKSGIPNTFRDAYYKFEVVLEDGKRYQLNRQADNNLVSIWIQEEGTGKRISRIEQQELSYPINRTSLTERQLCADELSYKQI